MIFNVFCVGNNIVYHPDTGSLFLFSFLLLLLLVLLEFCQFQGTLTFTDFSIFVSFISVSLIISSLYLTLGYFTFFFK